MAPRQLSVVVPTYDETDNLRPLTMRLFAATRRAGIDCDLLFADDESPGSKASRAIVQALQKEGYAVRLETRARSQGRGLSSAVLLGFARAAHETAAAVVSGKPVEIEIAVFDRDGRLVGHAPFARSHAAPPRKRRR